MSQPDMARFAQMISSIVDGMAMTFKVGTKGPFCSDQVLIKHRRKRSPYRAPIPVSSGKSDQVL